MPRPKPRKVTLRTPPDLSALSSEDLIAVTVAAPGKVTTEGMPVPWQATPRHSSEANRILRERGVWSR